MKTPLVLVLLGFVAALVACAETQSPVAMGPGPMYVATGVQTGSDASARFILPTNSLAEADIPRIERAALAPNVAIGSSFFDAIYDTQPIGNPNGYGYRYRSVYRFGYTVP